MQRCLVEWGTGGGEGPIVGLQLGLVGGWDESIQVAVPGVWKEQVRERATVGTGTPAVTFILGRSWGLVLRVEGTNPLEREEDGVGLAMSRDLESGLIFFFSFVGGIPIGAQRLLLALQSELLLEVLGIWDTGD